MGALLLSGSLLAIHTASANNSDAPGEKEITLIHTGDFHGHLIPRPNVRADADPSHEMEGGLARIYTVIRKIRREHRNTLLVNTGDTIQGSAETLYTRGQAIVDIVNRFGVDAFAPGNWDYVYGTQRFLELFAGPNPQAPWTAVASNVYYTSENPDYASLAGQRVLPPYVIKYVDGMKIGILGFTTNRGPQVVGSSVTSGFAFTNGDAEMAELVPKLRNEEKVDVLIVCSELGLSNNIRLAEAVPGIDVVLSSDMHEETTQPVVTSTGTLVVEEGQDGTMVGELTLKVAGGHVVGSKWTAHDINDSIRPNRYIAAMVRKARRPFVTGPHFVEHVNPINGSVLRRPIDSVIGQAAIPLQRINYSHDDMPAVIEGSGHDFLTDAFRAMTGAQVGAIRGFRYGTVIKPGPIKLEDIYHFVAIGPQIAIGTVKGQSIKNQIESAADGSLNPDVSKWTGGWLFGFSGLTMDLDPYATNGNRATNIMVSGQPLNLAASYTYASYWYAADPTLINRVPATNIQVLKDTNGDPLDGTEVVARYLESLPNNLANPELHRIKLLQPLPPYRYGFPEVQPLLGAQP
jgi:2',3'-cyclic-nucleotide 2'-phosphodiesterase (5'-nucleotidase family)